MLNAEIHKMLHILCHASIHKVVSRRCLKRCTSAQSRLRSPRNVNLDSYHSRQITWTCSLFRLIASGNVYEIVLLFVCFWISQQCNTKCAASEYAKCSSNLFEHVLFSISKSSQTQCTTLFWCSEFSELYFIENSNGKKW